MAEILHQSIDSLSHYLEGFRTIQTVISEPSKRCMFSRCLFLSYFDVLVVVLCCPTRSWPYLEMLQKGSQELGYLHPSQRGVSCLVNGNSKQTWRVHRIHSCFWFPENRLYTGKYNHPIGSIYHKHIANWVIIWYLPPIKGTRKLHWSKLYQPLDDYFQLYYIVLIFCS